MYKVTCNSTLSTRRILTEDHVLAHAHSEALGKPTSFTKRPWLHIDVTFTFTPPSDCLKPKIVYSLFAYLSKRDKGKDSSSSAFFPFRVDPSLTGKDHKGSHKSYFPFWKWGKTLYNYFMSLWVIVKSIASACWRNSDVLLREAARQKAIVHPISTVPGWERTVHVSRCPALYSGRIFVPLCRELIIFVFYNNQMWEF